MDGLIKQGVFLLASALVLSVLQQLVEDYGWALRNVALKIQISSWPMTYFHETVFSPVLCYLATVIFKLETLR